MCVSVALILTSQLWLDYTGNTDFAFDALCEKTHCYILVLNGCACTVTMVMNTALLKHFKITDNLVLFILDWNIYCCVCKTVT